MRKITRISIVGIIAALVGTAMAYRETKQWGYVVGYDVVGVFLLGGAIAVIALLLLIPRRTRSSGQYGLAVAVPLVGTFYVGVICAARLGAWNEPEVRIGPDVSANIVVLFRTDATNQQINSFVDNVDHLPGVGSVLLVRVGSHDGYAIQFTRTATPAQKADARRRIASSPLVWRTFENTAPQDVRLPDG